MFSENFINKKMGTKFIENQKELILKDKYLVKSS